MTRRPASFAILDQHERLEVVCADYGNTTALEECLVGVDVVFHLASSTQPKSSNDDMLFDVQTNLLPSINLAEACARTRRARLVFVSSGGTVYGRPQSIPIPETHSTDPLCSYGIVKVAIEKYLHLYRELLELDYCILRVSNPFGPSQHLNPAQGVVGNFIHQMHRGRPLNVWGDGSVVRDYIYIDDVIAALHSAGEYDGGSRMFNIGSGECHSILDVVATIGRVIGRTPDIRFEQSRAFDIPVNILDTSLAGRELGWAPTTTFEQGISKIFESILHAP